MIPQALKDWTLPTLLTLLTAGVCESDLFDFKEDLPHSKNESEKLRLRRACCAFANSEGGFLVFGIKDSKALRPEDRLIGFEPVFDFPEHFGNYPSSCSPAIAWDYRNPPIQLGSGRVLHVVYIPRSWRAPHGIGDGNGGWIFSKRTNKGTEGMSMEEIRASFLGYYEKRIKLQLLKAELMNISDSARHAFLLESGASTSYSLVTFDFSVVTSVVADTYSLTASYPELHRALNRIRNQGMQVNNASRVFFPTAGLATTNKANALMQHNRLMAECGKSIVDACAVAIEILDRILSE